MQSAEEILDIISQACGTTGYHRFSRLESFPVITDGVLAVAQMAECFWLLDVIGSYQQNPKLDKSFQVWTLEVNAHDKSAVVRGYNDTTLIITQDIPYTNFPFDKIKFFLMDGVLLLPGEH